MSLWLLLAALLITTAAADVTKGDFGAERKSAAENEPAKKAKPKRTTYPFHGTLDRVDPAGKSLTLRGKKKDRVILVPMGTRLQKNGAKARLEDGRPGERVSGLVHKNAEGQEEAVTIRFGPKPPAQKAKKKE